MMQKLLSSSADHRRHVPLGVIIAVVAVLLVAGCGIVTRLHANSELAKKTTAESIPTVTIVNPSPGPQTQDLVLPGNVQAYIDAPLYARTSGYLKTWYVDIGGKVKAGQLLAIIETPEVDQQLEQAEADLATAKANYELSEVTNKRWQALVGTNAVSRQEADEKASDAAAKKAQMAASAANVKRLHDLQSFQKIYAPFDGVLTARETDIGQLINAGPGGKELFHVASIDKLRTYVSVPQDDAPFIKVGMPAMLRFSEHPGKDFPGKVVRTANAIDVASRTLLTEVEVDNLSGELLPGAYADVHLQLPGNSANGAVRVPSNTLIFRSAGMQAAVVGPDNKIDLKSISIGRDFGKEVEIASGLSTDDKVVVNPPDSLTAGQQVQIAPPGTDGNANK